MRLTGSILSGFGVAGGLSRGQLPPLSCSLAVSLPESRRDTVTSTTSSLFLDQPEQFTPTPFSEDPDAG